MHKICLVSVEKECKSNSAFSSQLIRYFIENKCAVIKDICEADIIVVNTCGFNKDHEDFTIHILKHVVRTCRKGAKVISVGCLNKINREIVNQTSQNIEIINNFSDLDLLINADKPFNYVDNYYYDKSLFNHVVFFSRLRNKKFGKILVNMIIRNNKKYPLTHMNQILDEEFCTNKAYVKIGSGCLNNCSYCLIKKAKGAAISRSIPDILSDIKKVYKKGMVLNLVADDCGSYGFDIGENIFSLLKAIGQRFSGMPIEFCYINPMWLEKYPNEYLEIFKNYNINSVNIPLQSGSDRIIKLMNRKYVVGNILNIIGRIKIVSPNTMIWGHFIVDYPSETWKDFYLTLHAFKSFHYCDFFSYSAKDDNDKTCGIGWFNLKIAILDIINFFIPFKILFSNYRRVKEQR